MLATEMQWRVAGGGASLRNEWVAPCLILIDFTANEDGGREFTRAHCDRKSLKPVFHQAN